MSDLISRNWLIEELNNSGIANSEEDGWVHSFVCDLIANAPTVEARPSGEWEETKFAGELVCSNCQQMTYVEYSCTGYKKYNFCPNCGASMKSDMRGGKNE